MTGTMAESPAAPSSSTPAQPTGQPSPYLHRFSRADVLDVTVARPDVDGSYRNATLVEARVVPEER